MRLVRRQWCNAGRPRQCLKVSYRQYKAAKCDFKRLHRKVVSEYLKSLNDDIDRSAEINSCRFWKLVNARRKGNRSNIGAGIKFDNEVIRDRDQLTDTWCNYFNRLYICHPQTQGSISLGMTLCVSKCVHLYMIFTTVLPLIVKQAIEESPRGKADKIQYEHLIFAKDVLSPILANVFTCMMRTGYVPDKLKRGVIVTLHKGGGTNEKTNPITIAQ